MWLCAWRRLVYTWWRLFPTFEPRSKGGGGLETRRAVRRVLLLRNMLARKMASDRSLILVIDTTGADPGARPRSYPSLGLDHPLISPFRAAVTEGRVTGAWHYYTIIDDPSDRPCVIGSFVHTPGNRLLFFPGGAIMFGRLDPSSKLAGKRIDHLTLDMPDRGRWKSHVTMCGSPTNSKRQDRGLNCRGKRMSGQMFHWFSICASDLSIFEELPEQIALSFEAPRPDVGRFCEQALGNYRGHSTVTLPKAHGGSKTFTQIEFWVGNGSSWQDLAAAPVWFDGTADIKYHEAPNTPHIITRTEIGFTPDLGVCAFLTRRRGELSHSLIMRGDQPGSISSPALTEIASRLAKMRASHRAGSPDS